MKKNNKGFTLIELLVVMTILGILTFISLANFRTTQKKTRDAKRKSDLEQTQRALEMYLNDTGKYPLAGTDGTINSTPWGDQFIVGNTVYMKALPTDPTTGYTYCYQVDADRKTYQIYSILENEI